jgi:alpha-2-macroglobulin
MKSLSTKNLVAISAFVVAFVVTLLLVLPGKGSRDYIRGVDPAYGEYITSYSSGVLRSGATIRLVFTRDVVDESAVGKPAQSKLFSFEPAVKGEATWLDKHTIEFQPATRLISGQRYEVRFQLGKVMDVPEAMQIMAYSFQVIPQNYELSIDNIKPYTRTELTRQKIEGVLYTADYAEPENIEKYFSAKQNDQVRSVTWSHTHEGRQHAFTIEQIERKETAGVVQVAFKGTALGISRTETIPVEIPALGDFKVTHVRVNHGLNQHVVVRFSDPLSDKQNLRGLLELEGIPSLEYEVRDNEVLIFPPVRQSGTTRLLVEAGVRNILDYRLKDSVAVDVVFDELMPAARFIGKGTILPTAEGLLLPFEAVNLKAVDVQVIRIFEQNVVQFFQVNEYDGNSQLRRVGKPVLNKRVSLESSGVTDFGKWNRFTLDLASLINAEPGAIYQVRIGFKQAYTTLACNEDLPIPEEVAQDKWQAAPDEYSYWDSYEDYSYGYDYDWQQRDNPCHPSYYYVSERAIRRNIIASDLGLMAKRGSDGSTRVYVNDIRTTKPLAGVQLELFDYQQQSIGTASTGNDGSAVIQTQGIPFMLVATQGTQRGYLKLVDGESLSLSNFDVSGEQVNKGLKGFIYGERGVWRPGDSLFVTFLLEDKGKTIPPVHPVVFELQNPQGQVTSRMVKSTGINGFYSFATATDPDAPTGNWKARVKVGGIEFAQTLKIETIKPNRLKINLDLGTDKITAATLNLSGNLHVDWLHGAPGRNLKAEYEVLLTQVLTKFSRFPGYTFEDPSKYFASEPYIIFTGTTNTEGNATVQAKLPAPSDAPGMLQAVFRGKVFEESGNFSIDRFSLPFYPYRSFTGIRLPEGDKARGMLLTDTTHRVDVVTIDPDGNPVNRSRIEMSLYKLQWRSWWDNTEESAFYMSGAYARLITTATISTAEGKGQWNFRINYPEWGRYLVKAYDPVSGHSTAKVVYIDWPGWAGRAREGADGATMLTFSSDKTTYAIGEKVTLVIPGSAQGRALVSIENGTQVLESYWLETREGDTPFSFTVSHDMTPTIYAHVTLLQPHAQTINDQPIRMYGVIPITVEDPATHLEPQLIMPDVLEPGKEVVIKVSEKSKRTMTYTLAMVDEGLLDLTRFKTPDPWQRFYAREALGVKTWDIYAHVMGARGVRMERLLAIGGDVELNRKDDDPRANRFKPVVKYLGPFTLKGGVNEHRFVMPAYVGSVKTMLVAGYEGAYGSAEKVTPVRKPLMVLATLPRVLGPQEKVSLPVTLFAAEKDIRTVIIEVKTQGPIQVRENRKEIKINTSDQTVTFDLTVGDNLGNARVEVLARSGNYTATDIIDIHVRNPNPPVTNIQETLLEAGKSWNTAVTPVGIAGTNKTTLEISSIPPINLEQRMGYLLQYPYGCLEQVVSAVFPQLYIGQVKALTADEQKLIQENIRAGIERLKAYQHSEGGFVYWPGADDPDSWATTYAGHFLVEAEQRGYLIPADMLKRWRRFQRGRAQVWRSNKEYSNGGLNQAYRLYALALAGEPELGAMNRLREQADLPVPAAWMLAAAYLKAGQPEAARTLVFNKPVVVAPYRELGNTYGSDIRDKAIILETLVMLGDRTKAFDLVKELSVALSDPAYWMSTQSIAWSLKSVAAFSAQEKAGSLAFSYTYNGKTTSAKTELTVAQVNLPEAAANTLKVNNESGGLLFARIITSGIPARGDETDESSNLSISILYTDAIGNAVDVSRLEQGQEFIASVTVFNPGMRGSYQNMALNQIFPSGWEITNLRFEQAEDRLRGSIATYQDIRDDRVYTYFDLAPNERKTFHVMLTATYAGQYYLPAVSCEAMYDGSIYSRKRGFPVDVVAAAQD